MNWGSLERSIVLWIVCQHRLEHTFSHALLKWVFNTAKSGNMEDQLCLKSILVDTPMVWLWGEMQDWEYMGQALAYPSPIIIFPAKMFAIELCSRIWLKRHSQGARVFKMSDSQTAVKALSCWNIESRLVLECHDYLNKLAEHNRAVLKWVPGRGALKETPKLIDWLP